ncbi:hypothetical protein ILUMI_10351 [Ignelater luminosus]|uniref:Uncharacterized protein n=1 Tax=Ignelater luminosus TaxID=2038154 RepID=A0A8K0GDQ2_IGNLU|nr:hypothetical protein ILUMI_10351 [Ignelater luminosus]
MSSRSAKIMEMTKQNNIVSKHIKVRTKKGKPPSSFNVSNSKNTINNTVPEIRENITSCFSDDEIIQYAINLENRIQHEYLRTDTEMSNVEDDNDLLQTREELENMPIETSNESESDSEETENGDDIVATTNGNNSESSIEGIEQVNDIHTGAKQHLNRTRRKRRHVDKEEWDIFKQRLKRSKGEEYKGLSKEDGKWSFNKNRSARR